MMVKAASFIFTVILLLVFKFTYCNNADKIDFKYPYKQLTTLDGLPSNETYRTFQDSDGYIWICTDKGVSRYNGYEFENFTTADGLIDNTIFQITQDTKGRIWFMGFNTKLCYFENNAFHNYKYNDVIISHNELDFYNSIEDFAIDNNENVFVGYKGYGYIIINNKGETIEEKSSKNRNYIALDNFNPENGCVFGKKYFDGNYRDYSIRFVKGELTNIYLAINDTIVKTFSNLNSQQYDKETNINKSITDLKSIKTFIKEDSLTLFKQIDLKYTQNINSPILDSDVYKIFYLNNKFIKVDKLGVWILNANFKAIQKIFSFNETQIKIENITSLQEISNNLWINTNINGIYVLPNYYNPHTKNYKISGAIITGIFKQNDTLFFKNEINSSSFYINKTNQLSEIWEHTFNFSKNHNGSNTFYGSIDFKNSKYIIKSYTIDEQVYFSNRKDIYEYKNGNIIALTHETESNIFSLIHYKGQLLVGTQNGIKYLKNNIHLANFSIPKINIDNYRIQDMKVLNNYLIIATRGSGIYITDTRNTRHIGVKEGLASNIINQIFVDPKGCLWVATNNGVNSLSIKSLDNIKIIQNINLTHGIISPDVRQIYVDNGKAYLACDIGLSVVNYNEIKAKREVTPVFFKSITINDKVIHLNKINDTILAYTDNNLLFNFTGITPVYADNLIYRFKLVGLDDEWTYTKDRLISFNSLKPGRYTFIVQARSDRNDWSKVHPEFKFKITRPFWRSTIFISSIVISILSLSYAIMGFFYWSAKKRNNLQKELNKIKQESLNAQMNPHFVFNSLNSIQSFILKNDKVLANKYLVKFSRLMRLTFENSKSQYINLEDEIAALILYLDLEQMRFEESFSYEIEIDPVINTDACRIPTLLIQPFVENAIWHGIQNKASGLGVIKIEIIKQNDKLIISIEDNGIGYDNSILNQSNKKLKKHNSSGISITKKRLKLVNALENNSYTYKIINLNNKTTGTTGTLVRFTIPYTLNINEKN